MPDAIISRGAKAAAKASGTIIDNGKRVSFAHFVALRPAVFEP
jgi:hypothetical protein